MRLAIGCVILFVGSVATAAEHPPWDVLAKLFGQGKSTPNVVKLVAAEKLSEITKGPSGAFTPNDHAYSLLYRKNKIETIKVQVGPWNRTSSEPHWQPYSGELPGGLTASDGREEVIKKLGTPIENRKDTWLHDKLMIWVHFDQKEESISVLYVSPHVVEAAQ